MSQLFWSDLNLVGSGGVKGVLVFEGMGGTFCVLGGWNGFCGGCICG